MTNVHIILGAPKREAIKPLMQKEGFIIGVDRGAIFALEENIHVDLALGDFDSISEEEKEQMRQKVASIKNYSSEKNETDAEIAFEYVLDHLDVENIFVYNWYGGRIDHLHSLFMIVFHPRFEKIVSKIKYIAKDNLIEYFLPGEHVVRQAAGMDYLSYVLLTVVKGLTLREVKYEVEQQDYDYPLALISNQFISDKAIVSFEEGIIAAIQSRDSKE